MDGGEVVRISARRSSVSRRAAVEQLLCDGLAPREVADRMGWRSTAPVYDYAPPDWFSRKTRRAAA
jgi:hypothetical protein